MLRAKFFSKEKKYGINWYINQFIKWAKVSGLFVNIVRKLFTVHILYQVRSGLDLKYVILEFSLHNLDQWNSRDRAVFHQNSDEIFPYFIFLSELILISPRWYDCLGQFSHCSCFIYETSRDSIAAFSAWLNFFWWGKLPASQSKVLLVREDSSFS